ncbi:MAG: hypothetical protein JRD87_14080 [Deltaproteobacteria bacterium]|jgi:uncharacterized protein YjeT (DUF2065 family)|nr:hypothetical protein [Deltaproteobacteria bacterium]MBW2572662.1 hypothetical protein [Deltaproteobacteria bacterium]MBW2670980.1 hypothetical protein [Deltaproteobacteria bacterium]MBW2710899.1 hypothetical protein [Deltaproteobacteria bacterium]
MKWFLYAIALIWIGSGAWMILYSHESRKVFKQLVKNLDRRILCVLSAVVGILLILSASWSRQSWLIRLFGILAVIKGGFIFWNPNNLYDKITDWYLTSVSEQTYRFFGIITLIFGTVILSWIL